MTLSALHNFKNIFAVSLDRGRETFEEQERAMMQEVRRLREKLATEGRHMKPPPSYALGVV